MSEIDWKVRMYHVAPCAVKNLVATVKGAQIGWLRRGQDFEERVAAALAKDSWDAQALQDYQQKQLTELLTHSRKFVPYYRDYWNRNFPDASEEYISNLANWPVLEKKTVRSNPGTLISDTANRRKLKVWNTSGSTGSPTKVFWSQELQRKRWAVFEARHRRWYGVKSGDPFVLLGGRMVTAVQQEKPPFWVWNALGRQLYMSSYHLSHANIPHYLSEMKRRRVRHIYSYSSSVYEIAKFILLSGIEPPKLKVIVTQAEPLYDYQREAIKNAFKCPVRESYGMAEMVTQASECDSGNLHLWPEYGVCEVGVGSAKPIRSGSGDLIATGLLNYDMPLIRYRVGDQVTLPNQSMKCACGRGLPILECVEGRIDDVLLTRDGRNVGRLSTVFKNLPIIEAQTIQRSIDQVVLKIVPDKNFTSSSEIEVIRSFKERMGEIEVTVELVDSIPRGANGKFRAVVCEI